MQTYKEIGQSRMLARKLKRKQKYIDKIKKKIYIKENNVCQVCQEGDYCYCGDGTPYSY